MREADDAADEAGRRLGAQLETALLRELAREWARLNARLFEGALAPPSIGLHDSDNPLGAWERKTRHLRLSRRLLTHHPWAVTVEVLKHEMAHQYVHEVLGQTEETPHGPAFRELCQRLGIDAAAAGLPEATPEEPERARALRKVQRLLALAESPNPHEAEAALNAAHRLMRRHNIAWSATASAGTYGFKQLGGVKKRFAAHEKLLAGILSQHFFVQAIWALGFDPWTLERGRVLELCGSTENLAIAEHVHTYLLRQGERLWREHRRAHRLKGDAARRRFLSGMMVGFHDRLSAEAQECEETGLIWQGDADLQDWVGRRHPHLQRGRGPRMTADATWSHGRAAGRKINVHRPVTEDPSRTPRALTLKDGPTRPGSG